MMAVMAGASTDEHFFSSQVGMGSRSQCLSGQSLRSFRTSSTVTGVNEENSGGRDGGEGKCGDVHPGSEDKAMWSLLIFSEKKEANVLASEASVKRVGKGLG